MAAAISSREWNCPYGFFGSFPLASGVSIESTTMRFAVALNPFSHPQERAPSASEPALCRGIQGALSRWAPGPWASSPR